MQVYSAVVDYSFPVVWEAVCTTEAVAVVAVVSVGALDC